jgi:hypothetical protein
MMTKRKHHDLYPTPTHTARRLLDNILWEPKTILEPASDGGNFVRACKDKWPTAWVKGVDVDWYDKGVADEFVQADFLAHEWPEVDLIVTNPPFKVAEQFVHHARKFAPVVGMLLRLGFAAGQGRYHRLWSTPGLSDVTILSRRPSFTGDGKTDNSEYAFFVWRRGYKGDTIMRHLAP